MILLEMILLAMLSLEILCRSDSFWERPCLSFGNALRIWAYVLASRREFVESTIVWDRAAFRRLNCCEASVEELKAWRKESVCFFWPGTAQGGRRDLHGVAWWLMDG